MVEIQIDYGTRTTINGIAYQELFFLIQGIKYTDQPVKTLLTATIVQDHERTYVARVLKGVAVYCR